MYNDVISTAICTMMSLVKVLRGVCVQYTERVLSLVYLISVEGVYT